MEPNALVIGASSAIGKAIADQLAPTNNVYTLSRASTDYSEPSLADYATELAQMGPFQRIINCIGTLHDDTVQPEKNLRQIDADKLAHYYHVNTILPTLCIKHFHRLLDKETTSVFATLSAMVGSIGDNRLGGWYGYRSSKAALNMVVKTAAIEVRRLNKQACFVAIHPGTTQSELSAPFAKNVKRDRYYEPEQSAARILDVLATMTPEQTGSFLNWDGSVIEW